MIKFTKNYILILVLLISIEIIMTYPLFLNLNTQMPGFFSTDESFVVVWNAWRIKFSALNHLSLKSTDLISYPFGINLYSSNAPYNYLWRAINDNLSLLTAPVISYNLQVIFNLFLTAFLTYVLMYYLTNGKSVSLFSGIVFGFCPYIFVRSWQHLGETYLWPMPLFLWSLFRLQKDNRLIIKIMFILSVVLTAINYGVSYYAVIIMATFLIYLMPKWKENKIYIGKILLLSALACIILIPQFLVVFKNILFPIHNAPSAWNVYHKPFGDLFEQSVRPLSYILPAVAHPIFGRFTEQFIGSPLYGVSFTEHTLYLGWTTLVLAFIAFRRYKTKRKELWYKDNSYYIGFFLLLAAVAWFFSQPPWWKIGPIKIFMPSFFMYKILPMFRAYCRFGIVVMLAVAVLSGFGLKFILERFKKRESRVIIAILFCGLILFEFWNYPPFKVIDVSKFPAVYSWLKEQPKGVVIAEYPLDAESPNEIYRFYQIKHEKRIINYTIPGTYANEVAKTITKLSSPYTPGVLKWMGVKYVLVHGQDYLNTGLIEDRDELGKISKNPSLKFIKNFLPQDCPSSNIACIQKTGPIEVYEVAAPPIRPAVNE